MEHKRKLNAGTLLVFILTVGVLGIINTEMGVVGILPLIADTFQVTVTEVSYRVISLMLLIYGLANIVGNILAGKLLSVNAVRSMVIIPFGLLLAYICVFIFGE